MVRAVCEPPLEADTIGPSKAPAYADGSGGAAICVAIQVVCVDRILAFEAAPPQPFVERAGARGVPEDRGCQGPSIVDRRGCRGRGLGGLVTA